jgi:CheY-like chemotaxis protein
MEALKEGRARNKVNWVEDGVAALAYLRMEGNHANAHWPDLVLLDLNLPKQNGLEVLMEMMGDPDLRRIPDVIMTMSDDQRDIDATYDLPLVPRTVRPEKALPVRRDFLLGSVPLEIWLAQLAINSLI